MTNKKLSELAAQTHAVYERNAQKFDDQRTKSLFEKPWLDRFVSLMPQPATILDLGCGTGDPIARYFIQSGHNLVGLDASENMLKLARTKFPTCDWRFGDMRKLDLPHLFDGIIGWHSFFHLSHQEQRSTLPLIARHLRPNGVVMLTVGQSEGEVSGRVGDELVYHASLSQKEYRNTLTRLGLTVRAFTKKDPNCGGATVLLAQKADRTPLHDR